MTNVYSIAYSARASALAFDARRIGAAGGVAHLTDGTLLVVRVENGGTGATRFTIKGSPLIVEDGSLLTAAEVAEVIASGEFTCASPAHFEGEGLARLETMLNAIHARAIADRFPDAAAAAIADTIAALCDDRTHVDIRIGDDCLTATTRPSQRASYSIH